MDGLWKVLFGFCLLCSVLVDKSNAEAETTVISDATQPGAKQAGTTAQAETTVAATPRPLPNIGGSLVVLTKEDPGYFQVKKVNASSETYEGFIVDLMDRLADLGKFTYNFSISPDGVVGKKENGNWTGMFGKLKEQQADIVAGTVTVTQLRLDDFDFTNAIERFEAAGVIQRRSWTKENEIHDKEDLVNQTALEYGIAKGGALERIISESPDAVLQRMWKYLNVEGKKRRLESNNHGVQEARNNKDFMFILESNFAQKQVFSKPCELEMIKLEFYSRQYALGLQKRSPLRAKLNELIMELEFTGEMQTLKKTWFQKNECSGKSSLVYDLLLLCSLVIVGFFH